MHYLWGVSRPALSGMVVTSHEQQRSPWNMVKVTQDVLSVKHTPDVMVLVWAAEYEMSYQ